MDQISMVFQRVYLFQDTIYNNISIGRQEASREEVMEAAKKARCYDFIMALPEGFDTVVGEGGAGLSGGEQQRVCVARALINHPEIILADEPTGNLDDANEEIVVDLFRKLHEEGTTLIVVTHDPEVGDVAQRQIVLRNGRIAGQTVNQNFTGHIRFAE